MYEPVPDTARLRQGDVISELYLPRYSPKSIIPLAKGVDNLEFGDRLIIQAKPTRAIVLSQCCEFNEGKRNAFSLARLLRLPGRKRGRCRDWGVNLAEVVPFSRSSFRGKASLGLEELRAANQVDPEAPTNRAVNVFLLDTDGRFLLEPHIVDFTQVTSIKMEDKQYVLERKVLQLDAPTRRQFQLKLAYFYGRRAT